MIETLALILLLGAIFYVMRSARKRRYHMLERADYVDVASAMRRAKERR